MPLKAKNSLSHDYPYIMHLLTDLIVRMQPYPQRLKELCQANPDFAKALKSTNPKRFVSLAAVVVSYPPSTSDEVIGFYVYDYESNPPMFKQDFIVNVGTKNNEFVIYTRFSVVSKSRIIRDINQFYEKYPTYNKGSHHPKFEDLPDDLKPRALEAIELANKVKVLGLRDEISDEEYAKIDLELKKLNL